MCEQNGYWKTKKKLFRKNKYKQVWQRTYCLCGANSVGKPFRDAARKMKQNGATDEQIQEAFRSVIRNAR